MNKTTLFLSLAILFGTAACDKLQDTANAPTTPTPQQTQNVTQPESVVYTMKNYDEVFAFQNGLAPVKKGDKYGFIDTTGKEVVPPQYNEIAWQFHEGLLAVQQGDKWGFIDNTGKVVVPIEYDNDDEYHVEYSEPPFFENGMVILAKNGKQGIIDKTGKEIVPMQYGYVHGLSENTVVVVNHNHNQFGLVDVSTGKEILPVEYNYTNPFVDGLSQVSKGGRLFLVDKTGKETLDLPYYDASLLGDGLIRVKNEDDKWGLIDTTGRIITPPQYFYIDEMANGLLKIRKNDQNGFIDKTGKEVIPPQYYMAYDFSEGFALVQKNENGKWGVIDKTGREVAPFQYDLSFYANDPRVTFKNGLLPVDKDGKTGLIDTTGKEITPMQYDFIDNDFRDGFVRVRKNDKWWFIDKNGKELVPMQYDTVWDFSEGLAAVKQNDKWGFVDKTGKVVIDLQYDDIAFQGFSSGLIPVKKDNKWQVIDTTGKTIIQGEAAEVSDKTETAENTASTEVPELPQRFPNIDASQYATTKYTGKIAEDIADKKHSFRTRMREGLQNVRENPHEFDETGFAGHFIIVSYGCGTDCLAFNVVDVITGEIYDGMTLSGFVETYDPVVRRVEMDYQFNAESRLFFVQGGIGDTENVQGSIEDREKTGSFAFEFQNGKFKLLAYSPVAKVDIYE